MALRQVLSTGFIVAIWSTVWLGVGSLLVGSSTAIELVRRVTESLIG